MGSNRAHFPHGISSSKNVSAKLDPELVRYGTRVGRLSCGSAPVFRAFSAEPFRYLRPQIHFGHRQPSKSFAGSKAFSGRTGRSPSVLLGAADSWLSQHEVMSASGFMHIYVYASH